MEDKLLELVLEAKRRRVPGQPFPEIEIRFGHQDLDTNRFTAGLSKDTASILCTALINGTFWEKTLDWERSHVFLFTLPHTRQLVRTETIFKPGGIRTFTVEKEKIQNLNFCLSDTLPESVARKELPVAKTSLSLPCARVALAVEKPISSCDLPPTVRPEKVFVKHRRTFVLSSEEFGPVWEYTVTRRWGGDTARLDDVYATGLDDACAVSELEIECVNPIYFDAHSPMYIVQTLIAKARQMLEFVSCS
jgi:hypothetical protein